MLTELFVSNLASTTVLHGGADTPDSGTVQTLTVKEADGIFPVVHRGREQFHFKDRNPERGEEIFCCIATDGPHWTVIRGAENTKTEPHSERFGIRQVTTSEFFRRLGSGSTTDLVNAATVFGADSTGVVPAGEAIAQALDSGPVYLPSGIYAIEHPLNIHPGCSLITFGHVVIQPTVDFQGDAAIELVDGYGVTRIDGITFDGSNLGAGLEVYGLYAETEKLEAELRGVRIGSFPNSGLIGSGSGWYLERVTSANNYGSGFEMNFTDTFWLGCRALRNARYGFAGVFGGDPVGCIAKDNRVEDFA